MFRHVLMVGSLAMVLSLAACKKDPPTPRVDTVARGQELVSLGGCNHCHTPMVLDEKAGVPIPDPSRRLAGHPAGTPDPEAAPGKADQAVIGSTFTAFRAPFGVVYAANLTPDDETGIGTWTEAEFIETMRTGHRKGSGRMLLPPMPWQNLASLPESDLRAIYSYLRTIPKVKNKVEPPKVSPEAMAALEKGLTETKHAH